MESELAGNESLGGTRKLSRLNQILLRLVVGMGISPNGLIDGIYILLFENMAESLGVGVINLDDVLVLVWFPTQNDIIMLRSFGSVDYSFAEILHPSCDRGLNHLNSNARFVLKTC